jgi:hypothetical protein
MHYPTEDQLDDSDATGDEALPVDENGWTYHVQTLECSDLENCSPEEEHWQPWDSDTSDGSEEYSSDDEDHFPEESDQYNTDCSYEESNISDISESESEDYSSEMDYSQSQNDTESEGFCDSDNSS